MAAKIQQRSVRIAVDVNFLIDLHEEEETAVAGLELIRERLLVPRIIIPPTVGHELALLARDEDEERSELIRAAAAEAVSVHGFIPASFIAVNREVAERIANELISRDVIPLAERNDGLILAESALLSCSLLVTSDRHLLDADQEQVRAVVEPHASCPVIVSPAGLLARFDPRNRG